MLIACVADLHGQMPEIPDCDLVLVAGDLSLSHGGDIFDEVRNLYDKFMPWCVALHERGIKVIAIAGNHDFLFQKAPDIIPDKSGRVWTYLQDSGCTFKGLKIWGSPWQPPYYDWAFNLPEDELSRKWAQIPDDTDILMTHGPPQYYGDQVGSSKAGSFTLLERLRTLKPKLHVCGHIHVGYGVYDMNGHTTVVNCAQVNMDYKLVNKPIIIETETWNVARETDQTGDSDPQGSEDAPG